MQRQDETPIVRSQPPKIIVPAVDIVNVLNAEHIDPDAVIETVVYRRKYQRSGEIRYVYEGDA